MSLKHKEEVVKPTKYAWLVLIIIILIAIGNQWQRYTLAYTYGFKGDGARAENPYYEIKTAYPDLVTYYGILSGLAFAASYSVCGIFAGIVSDRVNRKVFVGITCILWSACTFFSGLIDSFGALFAFRFLLGFFESAFAPCAYGIISDYFHP